MAARGRREDGDAEGGLFVYCKWEQGGRVYKIDTDCNRILCCEGNNFSNVQRMVPTLDGGCWIYSNWSMGGGIVRIDKECNIVGESPDKKARPNAC